jgi:hypothetical protein
MQVIDSVENSTSHIPQCMSQQLEKLLKMVVFGVVGCAAASASHRGRAKVAWGGEKLHYVTFP